METETSVIKGTKPSGAVEKSSGFSQSADVWYADGSVVLVAGNTAFRVHSSILAGHCEVFKDMIAIPQPISDTEAGAERHEGCPVVRMHDSPADLKHFLKSIYDFQYFRPGVKTKFPMVAAVLRLGTKYHAPELRQRAIDFLASAYPPSLELWDKRSSERLIAPFDEELAAYIALAIEADIRVILPAVYFSVSRLPLAQSIPILRSLSVAPAVKWDICSELLLGREQLYQAELKHILCFLDVSFTRLNCQNGANCGSQLANAARTALKKAVEDEPWHHWCSAHPGDIGRSLSLCANCCTTVENAVKEGRKVIWERLPSFFGLPDWETLKARDDVGGKE